MHLNVPTRHDLISTPASHVAVTEELLKRSVSACLLVLDFLHQVIPKFFPQRRIIALFTTTPYSRPWDQELYVSKMSATSEGNTADLQGLYNGPVRYILWFPASYQPITG